MNKFYRFCAFRRTYFKAQFIEDCYERVDGARKGVVILHALCESCNGPGMLCSSFTKKTRAAIRKQETGLLYFSITLKTLQEFFKKEIEKLVSKETMASRWWGSETRKLGITQVDIRVQFSP